MGTGNGGAQFGRLDIAWQNKPAGIEIKSRFLPRCHRHENGTWF